MAFPPMDASFLVDGMTGLPTPPVAPVAPVAPPMAAPVLDDPMDPSALGLSPVGPAPERPTLGGQKPDSLAQIVRLAMLGLAAGMGPGRGTGLAQGMVLADQRRQQQQLQQDRIALQDYQIARSDWEQQQRQAAQEADRRGRVLMSALSNLERDLDATKSSADAERVYQMYGAALSAQGYRGYDPESLKRKFKNPDRKARAMKVVDAYMKNPVWVKVYESDPDAALEATVDLDGVGMTMREAMQIAGSGLIGKDGKAITPRTPPKADTRSIQVRAADALARGDRDEYNRLIQLERDFSAAGRAPAGGGSAPSVGSFEDYVRRAYGANPTAEQIVDARRKYQGQDGSADGGTLPPRVQQRVDAKGKEFNAQPVVKRVQLMAEAVQFADSLSPTTTNPADDQALIYAFAKAMDPESVVREGEYATVQKYAQSWATTYGFNAARIFSNTPFLTPQARENMKTTIRAKYQSVLPSYRNVRRNYVAQVDGIIGRPGAGNDWIVDYEGGFAAGGGGQVAPAPAGVPSYQEYLNRKRGAR